MAINIGQSPSTFNTLIPDLESDVADIQKAFRFYHYGNSNGSNTGVPGQGIWGFFTDIAADVSTAESSLSALTAQVAANTPAGVVNIWAGATAPTGWILCQGQAISRTTYASLYSALGGVSSPYGQGDGTSTFNVPNLKGRLPVGLDSAQTEFDALGETGGEKKVTLTSAQMPAHTHTNTVSSDGEVTPTASTATAGAHTHTGTTSTDSHRHSFTDNGTGSQSVISAATGSVTYAIAGDNASATDYTSYDSHSHTFTTASAGGHTHTVTVSAIPSHSHTVTIAPSGGGEAHNNLQPYIVMNYIIKA